MLVAGGIGYPTLFRTERQFSQLGQGALYYDEENIRTWCWKRCL